jgi:hypothetical protein
VELAGVEVQQQQQQVLQTNKHHQQLSQLYTAAQVPSGLLHT